MLKNRSISFIGSGQMAEAMISGLLKKKCVLPSAITASGPRLERAKKLHTDYKIHGTTNNLDAAKADIITLSVKPQTMHTLFKELHGKISKTSLIISIAAGISLDQLKTGLGLKKIVRAMPNTPGQINRGITVWTCTDAVNENERAQANLILGALGQNVFVDNESYLDMATALSGTGPAYVFLFMESLIDAGVRLGLPRYLAEKLVLETVSGSADFAKGSNHHLAKLRNDVTSPAGTSAEALYHLEDAGFRTALSKAVYAAHERSMTLGKSK